MAQWHGYLTHWTPEEYWTNITNYYSWKVRLEIYEMVTAEQHNEKTEY